jgi:hypothetical protein
MKHSFTDRQSVAHRLLRIRRRGETAAEETRQETMLEAADLLGSWMLESAWVLKGGAPSDEPGFGLKPSGVIHYLADRRMAVMIAHENRPAVPGGVLAGSPEALIEAARTFVAYAGTFSVDGDHVVHHLDISSSQSAVGADYVREVRLDGDRLELTTPTTIPEGRPMHLVWRRVRA